MIGAGCLTILMTAGGPPRNRAIVPSPKETALASSPVSTPSAAPIPTAAALAMAAGLPERLAGSCVDTGGSFHEISPVGIAIRCSDEWLTAEVARVAGTADLGDPLTAVDVWDRLAYRPVEGSAAELPWVRGDASICSSQSKASYSDYAVGSRPVGRIGGCTDEHWLMWTIDPEQIVVRIEPRSGRLAEAVSWFQGNRPVGGLAGLVWEVPWYACRDGVVDPGCDGPLPAESFETIWALGKPVSYDELKTLSDNASETTDRELVRLTGRIAFGFVDDGWIGIEVRQISSTSWDEPVMVPDAYLAEPESGDIIDVVGWVGEAFGMPDTFNPEPTIQPAPASTLAPSLPHVDVARYRSAD
jgi:hypothetical protein